MKTMIVSCAVLAATLAASHAHADCPTGSLPTQLQVPVYDPSQPNGPSQLSVDDNTLVTRYVTANGNAFLVYRPGASGWALERTVTVNDITQSFAVGGDTLAIAHPHSFNTLQATCYIDLFRRDAATGDWSKTSDVIFHFGNSATVAMSTNALVVAWPPSLSGWPMRCETYSISSTGVVTRVPGPDVTGPAFQNAGFGASMAIDGDMMAIGAPSDSEAGSHVGAVYTYRFAGGAWALFQKIMPTGPSPAQGFGVSVSMNGGHLAIGSLHSSRTPGDPNPASFANGYVEVYDLGATSFTLAAHLTNPRVPSSNASAFGQSVAVRGTRLVAGAYLDSYSGTSSGAAYVFDLAGGTWTPSGTMALPSSNGAWLGVQVGLGGGSAFAVAPFHDAGRLSCAVFDACALPPTGEGPKCLPGISGLMTYLTRWFAMDPWADFDNNGTLAVQDIMAFLNGWFAGCP